MCQEGAEIHSHQKNPRKALKLAYFFSCFLAILRNNGQTKENAYISCVRSDEFGHRHISAIPDPKLPNTSQQPFRIQRWGQRAMFVLLEVFLNQFKTFLSYSYFMAVVYVVLYIKDLKFSEGFFVSLSKFFILNCIFCAY